MNIILPTMPGNLSQPPSAADVAAFNEAYLKLSSLPRKERLAVWCYLHVAVILYNAVPGDNSHKALIADSIKLTQSGQPFDMEVGRMVQDWYLINGTGAGASANVETMLSQAGDFLELPENTLERLVVFLAYKSLL